jgi:Transcription factor S-II (TFIIS), central domain
MLFVNLKDKNNPGLRRSVTAGDIPAQTFAKMTSQVHILFISSLLGKNCDWNIFARVSLAGNGFRGTQGSRCKDWRG